MAIVFRVAVIAKSAVATAPDEVELRLANTTPHLQNIPHQPPFSIVMKRNQASAIEVGQLFEITVAPISTREGRNS